MRKLFLPLVAVAALVFTSCSNNEVLEAPFADAGEKLLERAKVERDVNGEFSINYSTSSTTSVDVVDIKGGKEFHLFEGKTVGKENHEEQLNLVDNKLSVDFIGKTKTTFIVEDDNILVNKDQDSKFLKAYSLETNDDGTYQLNFEVREGIQVFFTYNENEGIYEVNLKEGNANGATFSKTFQKEGNILKIDFINHLGSKSLEDITRPKRPRMIVVT